MDRFLEERSRSLESGPITDRAERNVIAQILENSYTSIGTALLRIAQGFDSSPSPLPALGARGALRVSGRDRART